MENFIITTTDAEWADSGDKYYSKKGHFNGINFMIDVFDVVYAEDNHSVHHPEWLCELNCWYPHSECQWFSCESKYYKKETA